MLILSTIGMLCAVSGLMAQEEASRLPIVYGEEVSETISNEAIFDHWLIDAAAGDTLQITMTGANGLAPLLGILDPGQSLQASSTEGAVNGVVSLTYTVPEPGTYLIVATRAGSSLGTTTGSYRLRVEQTQTNVQPTAEPEATTLDDLPFMCGDREAAPVFSIDFGREEFDAVSYSIRVYGFDSFQPALNIQPWGGTPACINEAAEALGDTVAFPGEATITLSDADLPATAQHILTETDFPNGRVRLTIGNLNGDAGRFAAVIGGFRIEPANDYDPFRVQLARSLAESERSALVYAIGVNNRLDPRVQWAESACDDAGRRGCEDVPPIIGAGISFNNGVAITGDRFDAGALISIPDEREISILSFGGTTRGEYAIVIYGGASDEE